MNEGRIEAVKQYVEDVINKYGEDGVVEIKIELDNNNETLRTSFTVNRELEWEAMRSGEIRTN